MAVRAYSNRSVLAKKFKVVPFEGAWLSSIGRPELRGVWHVYGDSGHGKTSFCLQLAKYLSHFGRVLYNSLEQGLSRPMQLAWQEAGMEEAGNRVRLLDRMPMAELIELLSKRQSPEIVIIDSSHYWRRLRMSDVDYLRGKFRKKLFIFISHKEKGSNEPKGAVAKDLKFDADVKVFVEGFRAMITSRYAMPELGEGGQDYIIWQEGVDKYWEAKEKQYNNTTDQNNENGAERND